MSDWSWKQALGRCILDIVNRKESPHFTLEEVYAFTNRLASLFPRNTRVRQKIRQVLQRLRDDEGFLFFSGKGRYTVNLGYEELESEPVLSDRAHVASTTRRTVRNVRLRDTFLASEIKRRYSSVCQVCRDPLRLSPEKCYAEGHHLRPLGSPHLGPDTMGNIIILCPNHHLLFDRAAATILPGSLALRHQVPGVFSRNSRLYLEPWRVLSEECLEYHHQRFLAGSTAACGN